MAYNGQRIQYCGVPQCKLCKNKQLDTNTSFHSNLSKKQFNTDFHQNCKTNLVIYLISCKQPNCCMKYVGRTNHAINRRLSLHRGAIVAGTEGPAMFHHFTKEHQPSDMIIKAIEVTAKATIKEREWFWIAELNTAFPYGLNDRVNVPPIQDAYSYTKENTSTNKAIYEVFNKTPSRRTKKGGIQRNRRIRFNEDPIFNSIKFMEKLYQPDTHYKTFFINYVRNQIMSLNKCNTKELFLHLCICINEHNEYYHKYNSNDCHAYLAYLARDIAFAKIKTSYNSKKLQHFIVIDYCNKYLDNINIGKIIKNKDVIQLFPRVDDVNMKVPSISYRYSQTIRSKITNYRQVISDGVTPNVCDCYVHEDRFKDAGHIFTGNLDIIQNTELRTLMKKGLNYREVPTANKIRVYKTVVSSIDSYINIISERSKIPIVNFKPWKLEILKIVQQKLDKLNCYHHNNVLSKKVNSNELIQLQDKWVFIPTDKASNNISIVCKKHYMSILDQEILASGNFIEENNLNFDNIIDNQTNFINKFNLDTSRKMPFLFWTAKLHKNPIAHRFITSGRGCATQPLSINIGYCLKTILNIIQSNSKFHLKKSGVNQCFVIDNRDSVISFMKRGNQSNYVQSVSTFDFKTLYTSIPHDKLKKMLASVINLAFNSRKKKFISITGHKAALCDDKKSGFSVSVNQLIDCVNFIIDQSFIVYKDKVYRQRIGIPMGTNCAPYLANLFLFAYEKAYVDKMIREGKPQIANYLVNVYRYQDDCIVFNDHDTFLNNWRQIYPVEMQLDKTNIGNSCTFLDLSISIEDGKFTYKSYDKRLDFNFEIINYPDLNSNVPRNPSYGVFNSQLMRFCDVNSEVVNFTSDIKNLVRKLIKQNFDLLVLKAKFRKFYANNIFRWSKFGSDIYKLIESC